jgi:hypothetical protein
MRVKLAWKYEVSTLLVEPAQLLRPDAYNITVRSMLSIINSGVSSTSRTSATAHSTRTCD